jgi:hypothetical protein
MTRRTIIIAAIIAVVWFWIGYENLQVMQASWSCWARHNHHPYDDHGTDIMTLLLGPIAYPATQMVRGNCVAFGGDRE